VGVIVGPIGTALEIAPPLIATRDDLARCTAVLGRRFLMSHGHAGCEA
jgi:putrescine aminotransferase